MEPAANEPKWLAGHSAIFKWKTLLKYSQPHNTQTGVKSQETQTS